MHVNKILEMAEIFEKTAGVTTFSAGDIQVALEGAGLWEKTPEVSAMLAVAKVPESASVAISIVISKGPQVSYNVNLNPPSPPLSMKLANMLKIKYGAVMRAAIQKAFGSSIDSTYVLKWITF